ncbi:MAG: hypothetical protein JWL88_95 [Parcubacteria group bacterium]|nr:hypothetical protein [Parcubacteria group bacterium]
MQRLEIDAELFDQLVESGGLKLSDNQLVIDLEKVVVARVHREVSAVIIDDSGEIPRLGLSETLRTYPKSVLDMEVMEFFSRDRMELHGKPSQISRALNTANNLCYGPRHEKIISTMREFVSRISLNNIIGFPNCGRITAKILVGTLTEAGLTLRDR